MRVAVFLLLLLPLVVYLDVIRFGAPGLSLMAVVALMALFVWAGFRALFKRLLPGRWVLVWALLLLAGPAWVLILATRQDEKIALSVTQLAKPIKRFKAEKGRFPETLREVPDFSSGQDFVTDRSLRIHGRVVSYGYASKSVTTGPDDATANLSYWSFGAMQRKIFNVGRDAFDASMNE